MSNSYIDPNFPLVELHRHLDGNVRLDTIFEIGTKHNLGLPTRDIKELKKLVQVVEPKPSQLAFFSKFEWLTKILINYDICRRVAYENVEDAFNEGIDYIELRFSPFFMAQENNLNPQGVVEAVVDGIEAGKKNFPTKVNLIGIISRTFGVESCWIELDAILSKKDDIIALDLAGDELNFPGDLFVEHFKKALDAGLHSDPHAGEVCGPETIWQTIHDLKAERLGHAVHAVEDEELIKFIAQNGIGVESSLTSNVQTSTVKDYASHPLKYFLEQGIKATINTDDPGISDIDIGHEYEMASTKAGLTKEQVLQAQKNALDVAFLTKEEKEELIQIKG